MLADKLIEEFSAKIILTGNIKEKRLSDSDEGTDKESTC